MNWRRGFAEVALIFVGITLALLFDNWNEARKDRILEEQLFAALRADLLETRADLVTDIEAADQLTKNTKKLIEVIVSDDPPINAGKDVLWRHIGTSRLLELLERSRASLAFYQQALTQLDEIVEMIDKEIGSSGQTVE
jgi:hypothetical protein